MNCVVSGSTAITMTKMKKELKELLTENRIEDVSWLCSLSESELDMLVSLKLLILQRARTIGRQHLVQRFDLKTLRALSLVLMEYLKGKLNDLSLSLPSSFIDSCNLVKPDSENVLSIEELEASLFSDLKKQSRKRSREEADLD